MNNEPNPGPETPMEVGNSHGHPTCGAKTRRGTPCPNRPAKGRTRCRFHGGAIPVGHALPQTKHGLYSKYLPQGLRRKYAQVLQDPEILSLRQDIATQTSLIMAEMEQLAATPEPPYREILLTLQRVLRADDTAALAETLTRLDEVLRDGQLVEAKRQRSWQVIRQLIQEKTKTVAAEWKRLVDMQGVITAERAMAFVEAILTAARDIIDDEGKLRAYQSRVLALLPEGQDT